MNIVTRELWANKKSLIIWSVSMIAFVAMMFIEFAAYYKNPEMLVVIEAIPREMLEAFGMADANLTTVSGYLKATIAFINLTLGIYAVLLGNSIIAKEERDKTAGFLMTLPIKRASVITRKLIASVLCCTILLLVVAVSILVAITPYETETFFAEFFSLVMLSSFVTMLIFLSIGMLLAAVIRRHKLSSGLGIGIAFAMYIASVVSALSENMEFLKYITPFMYFDASYMLRELSVEPIFILLSCIIVLISVIGTFAIYQKRDLYL